MADDPNEPSEPRADEDPSAGPHPDPDAAAKPPATVVRKKVTSRRVTPKGATPGAKPVGPKSPAGDDDDDFSYSKRYTPPKATYAAGPSPWWVPTLMFGLLIIGAVVIMANYMGAFGDPKNLNLVVGLAFILGGIITATQYR